MVTVAFPGMSASRVEQLLIKPVEEAVKQIPEADTVRSSAQTGLATVKVELLPTVTNTRPVWDNLRNKMTDLATSLPAGAVGPLVNDDYGRVAVTTLALTGADFSMANCAAKRAGSATGIDASPRQPHRSLRCPGRAHLAHLQQIAAVSARHFKPGRSQRYRRTEPDIAGRLSDNEDGMRYALEPSGDFRTVGEIGDVPVRTPSGDVV